MAETRSKDVIAKNIRKYMDINGETRRDICDALKVPYMTVVNWTNGNTYPRIDKIEALAVHWGLQKSELIEEKPANNERPLEIRKEVIERLRQLSPEEWAKVDAFVQGLLASRLT